MSSYDFVKCLFSGAVALIGIMMLIMPGKFVKKDSEGSAVEIAKIFKTGIVITVLGIAVTVLNVVLALK